MKMTITKLVAAAKEYASAAKQAGAFNKSTNNIFSLVDRIGKTVTIDGTFADKLPEMDAEDLPLGRTIQEYYIDLVEPEAFSNYTTEGAKDIVPALPSVEEVVYSYDLGKEKIKTTVPQNDLERACVSVDESANMAAKILERLNNSYSLWKFQVKKQLLGNMATKAYMGGNPALKVVLPIPTTTAAGENFIQKVKECREDSEFAHEGGLAGALIGASPRLTLYIKKGVIPALQVQTLAGAFHRDDLDMGVDVKVVDDFGANTEIKDVYAILVDPRAIKLHRGYHAIRTSTNADGDFTNYVDHSSHTGFISKYCFIKVFATK